MKKLVSMLLTVLILFTSIPISSFAAELDTPSEETKQEEVIPVKPTPAEEPEVSEAVSEESAPSEEPEASEVVPDKPAPAEEPESSKVIPEESEQNKVSSNTSIKEDKKENTVHDEPTYVPGYEVKEENCDGRYLWPVPKSGIVTQGYASGQHDGIDIGANEGTPVISSDDGIIDSVQNWDGKTTTGNQSYGNMVSIFNKDGNVTVYAHLSKVSVSAGDLVSAGDVIGYVGNTGNSTGSHLHYEIRENGNTVDPVPYITGGDLEKRFKELLKKYGGYIGEDGQLHTIDGREAIDKPLAEIAKEAGLSIPSFYAKDVTVSEPRSGYILNIAYTTDKESENGWGGKRVNGNVAYCVEHGVALGMGDNGGYSSRDLTKEQRSKLTLIDYWGRYKNIANIKGTSEAVNADWNNKTISGYYMAEFYTQLLIWETIHDFGGKFKGAKYVKIPSTASGMDNIASQSVYDNFKKIVMKQVDLFYTTPSISGKTVTLKIGETKTLTDTTGALASYKDTPSANTTGISVTKKGNKVTLTAKGTPNKKGLVGFVYEIDRGYDDKEPGYYYEHPVGQDVTTCGFAGRDPAYMTLNVNVILDGSLKIVKTSDDGKVSGIKFNVKGSGVDKDVTTKSDGTITVPNLKAGKYTITELDTEATFGYEMPDPKTVTVKEGEVAEVKFHNTPLKIGTVAKFEDGTKETQSTDNITLIDTVSYSGLQAGKEYSVSGILMNKATGDPLLNSDGNKITAKTTFTPKTRNGTVDVKFTFSSLMLKKDTDIVVFETLYRNNKKLTSHADIKDEGQTVKIVVPGIGTTATSEDGHRVDPLDTVTISDEVAYENLKPGKEYTVSGVLMNKDTGKPFLDADGKEIHSEVSFTPEEPAGTVTVTFTFNASSLHGTEIVVFEDIYYDGINIAAHADINDEGQTVEIKNPKISTVAVTEAGSKESLSSDDVSITDTISYSDLTVNAEYKITGILMDKESGKPFLDFNGQTVTAESTFIPELPNGSVELTFTFDSRQLQQDTELVVFDELYRMDTLIAEHKDLSSVDQTVKIVVPEIGTTATSEDGHRVDPLDTVTISDEVAYENLKPGKEYTVSGILMNKDTGKPFLDADGKEVHAESSFIPESPTGTVTVTFTFNASSLHGTEIVVFEDIYYDGINIAAHADINDEGQTVEIKNPKISTVAVTEAGSKESLSSDDVSITDTISYSDLTVNKEYRITGILMDKESGKPFLDFNGQTVTAETTFIPELPDGSVELTFTFDSRQLQQDTELVVFDELYRMGTLIAEHKDLSSVDQTVMIHPLHGRMKVLKLNSEDKTPLCGTKFGIYKSDTNELVEELITDDNGEAVSSDLLYGYYYLKEIEPSYGFIGSNKKYDFLIDKEGVTISFEITNKPKIGKMDLHYDSGNTPSSPVTGDPTPLGGVIGMALFSGIALILIALYKKKYFKNRNPKISILLLCLSILFIGTSTIPVKAASIDSVSDGKIEEVNGDTLSETKFFVSKNKKAETDFEKELEHSGNKYTLNGVSYSIVSEEPILENRTVSIEKHQIVGKKDSNSFSKTYTENSIKYNLSNVKYIHKIIDDYSAKVIEKVPLGYDVSEPEASDTISVPFYVKEYDLTIDCPIRLSSISEGSPYWIDDVQIPMTIYGVDSPYIEFNGKTIPFDGKTPPLSSYENLYLEYLDLSPKQYRLNSVEWDGDSFIVDGTVCRNAIISGERLVKDYTAIYGGSSTVLPEFKVYDAVATYETVQPFDTGEINYTIEATATYTKERAVLPVVLTAVGIFLIAAAIIIIIAFFAKKKKYKK